MARNYQLTINNIEKYEEIKEYLLEFEPNYLYSCIEENKKEKLHIHIYVQYTKCIRLSTKKTHGAHIEVCKGTPQQNKDYIDKIKRAYNTNNIIDEMGAIRLNGIKSNLAVSLMEKEFEEVYINEFKIWKEVKPLKNPKPSDTYRPNIKIFYLYGESGVGKSRAVHTMIGDNYYEEVSYANGYWLGVNDCFPTKIAWYDDFRDSQMPAYEFIKFIDYRSHQLNIKHVRGFISKFERIYITSIQSPYEIYRNMPDEAREQWIRRMTIIHMEKDKTNITRPETDN